MLTNFTTIRVSIAKMNTIRKMEETKNFGPLTKKEIGSLRKEQQKMEKNLGGIREMVVMPGAVFVIDTKKEHIAIQEAQRLKIPIVALLDTNADPDGIDFPIPGNDDAIRSIHLMSNLIADAVLAGKARQEQAPKVYADTAATPVIQPTVAPAETKDTTTPKA